MKLVFVLFICICSAPGISVNLYGSPATMSSCTDHIALMCGNKTISSVKTARAVIGAIPQVFADKSRCFSSSHLGVQWPVWSHRGRQISTEESSSSHSWPRGDDCTFLIAVVKVRVTVAGAAQRSEVTGYDCSHFLVWRFSWNLVLV